MSAPNPVTSLRESEVVFYPVLFKVDDPSSLLLGLGSTKDLGGGMVRNPDTALEQQIRARAESHFKRDKSRLEELFDSWASQVLETGTAIYEELDQRLLEAQAATTASGQPHNVINCTNFNEVQSHMSRYPSVASGGTPSQEEITQSYLSGSATDAVNLIPPRCFTTHKCRLATDEELDAYIDKQGSTAKRPGIRPLKTSEFRG